MLDVQAQGYRPTWSSPPQANQPHLRDWKTEAQQGSLTYSRLKLHNKAGFCPGSISNSLGGSNSGWAESRTEVTAHWQLEGEMSPASHHHTARNYYPRPRSRSEDPKCLINVTFHAKIKGWHAPVYEPNGLLPLPVKKHKKHLPGIGHFSECCHSVLARVTERRCCDGEGVPCSLRCQLCPFILV